MSSKLLLFLCASLSVGFMEPVETFIPSIMQNLLCINPYESALTKGKLNFFKYSSSVTTLTSIVFDFSSNVCCTDFKPMSYNAQWIDCPAESKNETKACSQSSWGQK